MHFRPGVLAIYQTSITRLRTVSIVLGAASSDEEQQKRISVPINRFDLYEEDGTHSAPGNWDHGNPRWCPYTEECAGQSALEGGLCKVKDRLDD